MFLGSKTNMHTAVGTTGPVSIARVIAWIPLLQGSKLANLYILSCKYLIQLNYVNTVDQIFIKIFRR